MRKKDLLKADGSYDYTPGCPGCEAIMVGMPAVAHNADCRMRVTHRLETTEEGGKKRGRPAVAVHFFNDFTLKKSTVVGLQAS